MKRPYSLLLAMVLALASSAIYAQTAGIAGKWSGELPAAQGRGALQPITVELKLEAETLTGTVTEGALGARPITNAAVEGGTFSFRTTQNFGGQDIVVNWFGEVKGDELALTRGIGPTVDGAGGGGGGRGGGGAAGGAAGAGAAGGRGAGGAAGAAAGGAPQAGAAGGRGGAGGGRGAAAPPTDGAAAPAAAPAAAGGRGAAGGQAGAQAGAQPAADPLAGAAAGGRGAAGAAGAAAGGRGGAAGGGRGGGGAGAGGGRGGGAAAAAGVTRVNGGTTLTLRRAG